MKSLMMKALMIMALALVTSFTVAAEIEAKAAHIASPDIYQLLMENDEVMVLKMVLKPGQSDGWHKHNAETVYFEQGGKAKIKTSDTDFVELEIPQGYVMWHDQWEHQVTNTGDSTITAIIVERKAGATKEH